MANNKNSRTWAWNEEIIPEVEYMMEKYHLRINSNDHGECYALNVHGVHKTYNQRFKILFHDTVMDETGKKVVSTKFNFIPILDKLTWDGNMGYTPEIAYLAKNFNFIVDPDSDNAMYQIKLQNETWLAFPRETKIKFSKIKKNEAGEVESLSFDVVVNKEKIWYGEDGDCPEMEYLRKNYGLITDPDDFEAMYRIKIKDEWFSYPNGARCVITRRVYNEKGKIIGMRFKWQKLQWV